MEDGPGRDDLAADAELLVGERREEAEQLDDVQVVRVLAEDELQHRKEERDGERLEDLPASTRRRQGRRTLGDERGDPVGRLADGGVAVDCAAVAGVGAEVLEGGLDVVEVVRPEEGDAVGVGAGEAECLEGEEGEDVVDGGDVGLEEAEEDGLELVPEELGRRADDGGEDLRVERGEGGEEAEGLGEVVLEAAEDVVEDGGGGRRTRGTR